MSYFIQMEEIKVLEELNNLHKARNRHSGIRIPFNRNPEAGLRPDGLKGWPGCKA